MIKMLDGQKALGGKVGTKALGEHKVRWRLHQLGSSS
jgi:hypothetical protein